MPESVFLIKLQASDVILLAYVLNRLLPAGDSKFLNILFLFPEFFIGLLFNFFHEKIVFNKLILRNILNFGTRGELIWIVTLESSHQRCSVIKGVLRNFSSRRKITPEQRHSASALRYLDFKQVSAGWGRD